MLQVNALNQYYGGSHILRNVSFEVATGKLTTLLGRNGVGKSTLLKCLMGVVPTRSGSIHWDGKPLEKKAPYERVAAGLAYVPQGREIFPRLTVEENLLIGAGERALWIEQAQIDAASPLRHAVPGLDGLNVLGTLWAVGAGATQDLAEMLAERLPYTPALRAGVTCLAANGQSMLLLRVLGGHMEAVRQVMTDTWQALRMPLHGVAAQPLRLWAT